MSRFEAGLIDPETLLYFLMNNLFRRGYNKENNNNNSTFEYFHDTPCVSKLVDVERKLMILQPLPQGNRRRI